MISFARNLLILGLAISAFAVPTPATCAGDDPVVVHDTRVVTLDLTGMT